MSGLVSVRFGSGADGCSLFQFWNTEHSPSLLLCRFIASPLHVLVSCSGFLNEEQQSSTTSAAADLDILKKPWTSNFQAIDPFLNPARPASASSEDDSTGLPSEDDSTGLQLSRERAEAFAERVIQVIYIYVYIYTHDIIVL